MTNTTIKLCVSAAGMLALGLMTSGLQAQNVSTGEIAQTTGQPSQQIQGGKLNVNELADPATQSAQPGAPSAATAYQSKDQEAHVIHRDRPANGEVVHSAQPMDNTRVYVREHVYVIEPRGVQTHNMSGSSAVHSATGDLVMPGTATAEAPAIETDNGRMAQ
ncbi:MAG TPA: hypothetical protein VFB54_06825 [Burkholderiales bacterium]|nr:hypothetical protein [Burkholderiales bacterium]